MTEIVERLERQAINVENDGHVSAARAMRDAAQALTEARAEIGRQANWIRRLQTALMFWMPGVDTRLDDATRELAADDAGLLAGYSNTTDKPCWGDGMIDRAIAAESELSTLRARVREVVGPFSRLCEMHVDDDDKDSTGIIFPESRAVVQVGHLRAARQLMEEVK